MHKTTEIRFDAASALCQGAREHQEDAVIADFPVGTDIGLVVLSDGMGGHAAGDVASKIVMTEVFAELKFQSGDPETFTRDMPAILTDALYGANECLAAHIAQNPEARGMGATLIAAVFQNGRLNWASVGDSPLYLYRGGVLRQLNEDHSMAPQIDLMADSGLIDSETARDHPDRSALTSVLGGDEIARIDCPEESFELRHGDVVIAASDGLQFVDDNRIASILSRSRGVPSTDIVRKLLGEIEVVDDPEQDNISMAVIRVEMAEAQDGVADAVRSAFDFAKDFELPDLVLQPMNATAPEAEASAPEAREAETAWDEAATADHEAWKTDPKTGPVPDPAEAVAEALAEARSEAKPAPASELPTAAEPASAAMEPVPMPEPSDAVAFASEEVEETMHEADLTALDEADATDADGAIEAADGMEAADSTDASPDPEVQAAAESDPPADEAEPLAQAGESPDATDAPTEETDAKDDNRPPPPILHRKVYRDGRMPVRRVVVEAAR